MSEDNVSVEGTSKGEIYGWWMNEFWALLVNIEMAKQTTLSPLLSLSWRVKHIVYKLTEIINPNQAYFSPKNSENKDFPSPSLSTASLENGKWRYFWGVLWKILKYVSIIFHDHLINSKLYSKNLVSVWQSFDSLPKYIGAELVRLTFYQSSDHLPLDCIHMTAVTAAAVHEQQIERLREMKERESIRAFMSSSCVSVELSYLSFQLRGKIVSSK